MSYIVALVYMGVSAHLKKRGRSLLACVFWPYEAGKLLGHCLDDYANRTYADDKKIEVNAGRKT